ncbi:MAG: RNA polymerase sigma factor [Pseudarcicella sp.]|nr:RNA polymerase sigma factor [Pseudarcicella sp.]MBP6411519.1 RNA polymerase sigma factor [Pseudarcicella sp.]
MTTERDILTACQNGDKASFKKFYQLYASKMLAVCCRYMKNKEEAEDVLQEAFIKIFNNLDTFRGDAPIIYWVKKIVVNTALNQLNKNKQWQYTDEINDKHGEEYFEEGFSLQQLNYEQLIGYVRQLPVGCQTVFNMFAIEGYKHSEIAEMLQITEGTSKSQYARSKELLKTYLMSESVRNNG